MRRKGLLQTAGIVLGGILLMSCGAPAPTPTPTPEAPPLVEPDTSATPKEPAAFEPEIIEEPVSVVPLILDSVHEMIIRDGHEAALEHLASSMAELPDGSDKGRLFTEQIYLLLQLDLLEDAQSLFKEAMNDMPLAAAYAHGVIENHLEHSEDAQDLIDWSQSLIEAEPPPALYARIARIQLHALQKEGLHDEMVELLNEHAPKMEVQTTARIVGELARHLLSEDNTDRVEVLQKWLSADGRDEEAYRRKAALLRIDLIKARRQWDDFATAIMHAMPLLHEGESGRRLDQWCRDAARAGQLDAADDLALDIVAQREQFPSASVLATRWRLVIPRERGDMNTVLSRFAEFGRTLPPPSLPPLISWVAETVFSSGDAGHAGAFLKISDDLPWSEMGDDVRNRYTGILLDISFHAGDYEYTKALLDVGVQGYDQRWHEVMLNKVLAHEAEEAGRTDEALARYRRFMEQMTEDAEETMTDPETGHRVTVSMIKALNARRIANILLDAGRADEAAEVFSEAAGQYRMALDELGAESREGRFISEQLEIMSAEAGN